ncbi:MAG TPA: hypothetical protein VFU38_03280 [Candidatus Krumholzibacteria bacterium]|nr:hypothetical protein [Candidatus Krumholzibacteria bacterium]
MGRIPLFVLAVGMVALCAACASDTLSGDPQKNQPPNVWLSSGPPEGSTGTYTVTLFWGGWDPDGEIRYYEYLVTDNVTGVFNPADTTGRDWLPVVGNDSTFTFSADSLLDANPTGQKAIFIRSHTFFIRAVDEDNARSTDPAYRSFTSRTISPEVRVTTPRAELGITPADMPPISTISWIATDYIDDDVSKQDPDSVQWAMVSTAAYGDYSTTIEYLRTHPDAPEWYPWSWYKAPNDSGKSWTTPPLEFGDYVFAIRAKDEAGAITPVLTEPVNVRRVKIQARISGPTFVITSDLIGSIIAASCDYPLTIVDVPAGVDLSFSLSACADHYGGTVSGYRYGWDILDLEDPAQWETDYTPFISAIAKTPPRAFNFGTHTFTAEVIDNSGFCSRIEVKVNIVRFSGERNLMVVDDYRADENPGSGWITTNGGVPNDAEHDNFWLDMVSNLEGFDSSRDMIAISVDRELPLTTIASYKGIIWSAYSDVDMRLVGELPLLYTYIQYRSKLPPSNTSGACSPTGGISGKVLPNYISLAMQAGVHVLITGTHPVQNALSRINSPAVKWPAIPLYEFERGALQTGSGPRDADNPPGDHAFAYKDLCLEAIDFGYQSNGRIRSRGTGSVANQRYCPTNGWRTPNAQSRRDDGMRSGIPADPNFPEISLRPEAADPGRLFSPTSQAIDVEVYNPEYFRQGAACVYVPAPRPCFQPIYLLGCLDTDERTYQQPVAFWTSAYADVVSEDIPGAVGARSAVFGFPPVYFSPGQVKPGIEYILFEEWQLPRKSSSAQSVSQARLDGTTSAP